MKIPRRKAVRKMSERPSATQLLETIIAIIETWFLAEEREYVKAMKNQEGWNDDNSSPE